MTNQELKKFVTRSPFRPFRVVLADGEEVVVNKPKALVSGDDLALVGISTRPGRIGVERFRIIDVSRVVSAEQIDNGSGPLRKGRSRR